MWYLPEVRPRDFPVHASCCLNLDALLDLPSSTSALICFRIYLCFSFPLHSLCQGVGCLLVVLVVTGFARIGSF